jgi:hypothetical protein
MLQKDNSKSVWLVDVMHVNDHDADVSRGNKNHRAATSQVLSNNGPWVNIGQKLN